MLEGAIFSYNLLTPVSAVADENIRYQDEIVFPKGTKFIGVVQVVHSLDRVNIDFHTCVFPDGEQKIFDLSGEENSSGRSYYQMASVGQYSGFTNGL